MSEPISLLSPPNPALDPSASPKSGGILLNAQRSQYADPSSSQSPPKNKPLRRSASLATPQTSNYQGGASLTSKSWTNESLDSSKSSPKLTFAPLPVAKPRRRSSITLGVAARSAMLAGSPRSHPSPLPQPPSNPAWYEKNGTMPTDVKTVNDLAPAFKKIWKRIKPGSSPTSPTNGTSEVKVTIPSPNASPVRKSRTLSAMGAKFPIEEDEDTPASSPAPSPADSDQEQDKEEEESSLTPKLAQTTIREEDEGTQTPRRHSEVDTTHLAGPATDKPISPDVLGFDFEQTAGSLDQLRAEHHHTTSEPHAEKVIVPSEEVNASTGELVERSEQVKAAEVEKVI